MKPRSNTFLWGVFLVCLGTLFLLNSFGLLRLDDEIGAAMVFFSAGVVLLTAYFVFKKKLWTLIVGCVGVFLGIVTYIDATRFVPEEFIGISLFVIAGLVVLSALRRGRKNWWSIIPGGFCLIIAGHILLDISFYETDNLHAVLFFGGTSLIFGVIYLLKNAEYKLGWAKYPGLAALAICAIILFAADFEDVISRFFFPVLLVAVGALMLVKSLKSHPG